VASVPYVSTNTGVNTFTYTPTTTGTYLFMITTYEPYVYEYSFSYNLYIGVGTLPTVTGLSVSTGPATGGTSVTITGTGFTGASASWVQFGSTQCGATGFSVNSAGTSITCISPAVSGGGTVDVTVTNPATGSSVVNAADKFSYTATLTATTLAANTAYSATCGANSYWYGTYATGVGSYGMTGKGWLGTTSAQLRTSGTAYSENTGWTYSFQDFYSVNLTAGKTYTFQVTCNSAVNSSYTATAQEYLITALYPQGSGTTLAAINGTQAASVAYILSVAKSSAGTASYTIGGVDTFTYTPTTSGTYVWLVSTYLYEAQYYAFNYTVQYGIAPTVTGLSVTSGPASGGTSITVTGSGFTGATYNSVKFGTTAIGATGFSVTGDTQMTVVSPPGTIGTTVDIRVTSSTGTSAAVSSDQFSYGATVTPTPVTFGSNGQYSATGTVNASSYWWGTYSNANNIGGATTSWAGLTTPQVFNLGPVLTDGSPAAYIPQNFYAVPMTAGVNYAFTLTYGTPVNASYSSKYYMAAWLTPGSNVSNANQVVYVNYEESTITSTAGAASYNYTTGVLAFTYTPSSSGTFLLSVSSYIYEPQYYGYSYSLAITQGAPAVSSISPSGGSAAGGTTVTVNGSGFTGATSVQFGTTTITSGNFTINSDNSITVTSPAGTNLTSVDITVTSGIGTSITSGADQFSYGAATLTPTAVTVPYVGTGAVNGNSYWWGVPSTGTASYGLSANSWLGTTSPQVKTLGSPYAESTFSYSMQNFYSVNLTAGQTYTFTASWTSPTYSPTYTYPYMLTTYLTSGTASGNQVAYVGYYSSYGTSQSTNGTASFTYVASTNGIATFTYTPTVSGTYVWAVAGYLEYYYGFNYYVSISQNPPVVTAISPISGPPAGGTTVTITGSGFTGAQPSWVLFGSTPASSTGFSVTGDTSITCVSPAGTLGSAFVTVFNPATGPSTVTPAAQFSWAAVLTPTAVTVPYVGTGTINGNSYWWGSLATGTSTPYYAMSVNTWLGPNSPQVNTYGYPYYGSFTSTMQNFYSVNLTAGLQYTFTASWTSPTNSSYTDPYFLSAYLTSGSVPAAIGANQVAYSGYEYSPASAAGTATFTYVASTTGIATFTYTPTVSGPFLYTVAGYLYESYYYGFNYSVEITQGAPKVTAISPSTGPVTGGTTVTITGTGFTGAQPSWVLFGSNQASSTGFTVTGDTSITCVSPAASAGTVDIVVNKPGSGASTYSAADKYSYVAVLSPTSVTVPYVGTGTIGSNSYWWGALTTGTSTPYYAMSANTWFGPTSPQVATYGYPYYGSFTSVMQNFYSVNLTAGLTYSFTASWTSPTNASYPDPYFISAFLTSGSAPAAVSAAQVAYAQYSSSYGTSQSAHGTASFTYVASTTGIAAFTYTPTVSGPYLFTVAGYFYESYYYGFNYNVTITQGAPTVTAVSPSTGPSSGGTSVTITGTGFTGAQPSWVLFGSNAVSSTGFSVTGDTSITCISPAGSTGSIDVTVNKPNSGPSTASSADKFSYVATISPTTVTVPYTGTGTTNLNSYWWGTLATGTASYGMSSNVWLGLTSPQVGNYGYPYPGGSTAFSNYTPQNFYSVNLTAGQTYAFTASWTSPLTAGYLYPYMLSAYLTPGNLPAALSANQVAYSGYENTPASAAGTASFTYVASTTGIATFTYTPTVSGPYLYVVAGYLEPQYYGFNYSVTITQNAATVTAISTSTGPVSGGTTVTITGTGFTGAQPSWVTFGSAQVGATGFSVSGDTSITCLSPAGSTGTVNIVVAVNSVRSITQLDNGWPGQPDTRSVEAVR
jgi:hypothetical protein